MGKLSLKGIVWTFATELDQPSAYLKFIKKVLLFFIPFNSFIGVLHFFQSNLEPETSKRFQTSDFFIKKNSYFPQKSFVK